MISKLEKKNSFNYYLPKLQRYDMITSCRTPLNGLPDLLKVRSRHRKVRVTFNPRTSYFRAGVKDVDFMSLGVALVQSLSPRLKGRSRMSCKNHLLQVGAYTSWYRLIH